MDSMINFQCESLLLNKSDCPCHNILGKPLQNLTRNSISYDHNVSFHSNFSQRVGSLQHLQIKKIKPFVKNKRNVITMQTPDFFPSSWKESRQNRPIGPSSEFFMINGSLSFLLFNPSLQCSKKIVILFSAHDTVLQQLECLKNNDDPYPDHGVEVMYRFAGFDPFARSKYFGKSFDLGQFERFRRIFHHTTYRVLLGHKEYKVLSYCFVGEHCFKQRVWIDGVRPGEEGIFEFTLVQRVGGNWDGFWLTDTLIRDDVDFFGNIAY